MRAALALGRRGQGQTWPNPAVGCVIVRGARIVGRGWTQPGGRPHAEVLALAQAGALAKGGHCLCDARAPAPMWEKRRPAQRL